MSSRDLIWMKVLLVEDNPYAQEIMRTILRHIGVGTVQVCDDGGKALARISAEPFDLLLLDWRLPSMNGVALTQAIRGLHDRTRAATPIVMITAHADAEHVAQARAAGVDGFLVKPTSTQAVRDRVTGMVESGRVKPAGYPSGPLPSPDAADRKATRDGSGPAL